MQLVLLWGFRGGKPPHPQSGQCALLLSVHTFVNYAGVRGQQPPHLVCCCCRAYLGDLSYVDTADLNT